MPGLQLVQNEMHDIAAQCLVVLVTVAAIGASVLVHYEGLSGLSMRLASKGSLPRRRKVLFAIWVILFLHIIEIWIFGLLCWLLMLWPACGHIEGADPINLANAFYLSATSFSTLGTGDLAPVGAVRFMIGMESLVGLVLITWSASFTYLEMQQFWSTHQGESNG